jgi:excinuclease ABC subunit B
MYNADRSRKSTLVEHGFRLPSALDNRPLQFDEFYDLTPNTIYVSATPGDFELETTGKPVELVVRPTGLLDPEVEVRPLDGQVDDVIAEVRKRSKYGEKVIITTLTKKNSERLSDYLNDLGINAKYLHSEIDAIQRVKVINELKNGDCDCLIGINLLREGIDLPEVTLVAILDADKEGFLRSKRALLQIVGRAARNSKGRAILYADKITNSIQELIDTTEKRRKKQIEYNIKHNITPTTIKKKDAKTIAEVVSVDGILEAAEPKAKYGSLGDETNINDLISELEREMLDAAQAMEFERAADIRDQIKKITRDMDFTGN